MVSNNNDNRIRHSSNKRTELITINKNEISTTISPMMLIRGLLGPDYHQVKKLNFGDYVQAYDERGATNTNRSRSVVTIALHPLGNTQGGLCFMSLLTGDRIHRYQ